MQMLTPDLENRSLFPILASPPPPIIPVDTRWTWRERLGAWRVRWALGRMRYVVAPGLYTVGHPSENSPVLVTANYRLTFDILRRTLAGMDAWILVVDTKGINVWCAAGKGTFCAEEVAHQAQITDLASRVHHRTLILPQLAGPGVAAHEVKALCGFTVIYGPVRAEDIPAFLANDMSADRAMRTVRFSVIDRLVTIPVELVHTWRLVLAAAAFHLIAWAPTGRAFSAESLLAFLPYFGAIAAGCLLTPILLPWIPGRALAWKGWLAGLAVTAAFNALLGQTFVLEAASFLLFPSISAFLAMNFTGATTYTSLSGVNKEMRYALPLQAISALGGIALYLAALWGGL